MTEKQALHFVYMNDIVHPRCRHCSVVYCGECATDIDKELAQMVLNGTITEENLSEWQ